MKSVCLSADESGAVASHAAPTPELNQKILYQKYSSKNEDEVKQAVKHKLLGAFKGKSVRQKLNYTDQPHPCTSRM